jgi:hypothetical protein
VASPSHLQTIHMWYFVVSSLVLAALLFFPISKMVWVLSVRRLERRLGTELTDVERQGQLARARFIAVFVSLIFALLFNYNLIGIPSYG